MRVGDTVGVLVGRGPDIAVVRAEVVRIVEIENNCYEIYTTHGVLFADDEQECARIVPWEEGVDKEEIIVEPMGRVPDELVQELDRREDLGHGY